MRLISRLFAHIILVFSTETKISIGDRLRYLLDWMIHLFPFAIILKLGGIWFDNNQTFVGVFFWALLGNMIVGIIRHLWTKSFSWLQFFGKNALIVFCLVIMYVSLELLLIIVGNFPAVEYFETTLQATTLMYPISKILKNIHILSNRRIPPKWIMDRIYNFEKTGELDKIFRKKNL